MLERLHIVSEEVGGSGKEGRGAAVLLKLIGHDVTSTLRQIQLEIHRFFFVK
jgi:hypothetical protein